MLLVSAAYEWLFVHHGLNRIDEGVVLYPAMRLHAGGVLHRDVVWNFPPGHLLPAWIAYGLAPPGVIAMRLQYAALNVALCLALYRLGRRLVAPAYALLGALMVAIAAPDSHLWHYLFGYRYLVLSVGALLLLAAWLRSGASRFLFGAGLLTGVACCFRLTPAFAASCGVAAAIVSSGRGPRAWLRDGGFFALGLLLVVGPTFAWLTRSAEPAAIWQEVVHRPIAMASLQGLPLPSLAFPETWSRADISRWFSAFLFRAVPALYAGYAVALAASWVRARARRQPFPHALLTAVVVFSAVYLLRAFGRSDQAHLDSALPPACLVFAHLVGLGGRAASSRLRSRSARRALAAALCTGVFTVWGLLLSVDVYLSPERRGLTPFESLDGRVFDRSASWVRILDDRVRAIREWTRPGDEILDLTGSPLFYVLSERTGPGWFDIVLPGSFLDASEESRFLERLRARPPALVIWPHRAFDHMESRSLAAIAPQVGRFVVEHYRPAPESGRVFPLLLPRGAEAFEGR